MWFEKEPLLQKYSITEKLTNKLWNCIYESMKYHARKLLKIQGIPNEYYETNYANKFFIEDYANNFWIIIDEISPMFDDLKDQIKFNIFNESWFWVYDYIEFYYKFLQKDYYYWNDEYKPINDWTEIFKNSVNIALREENSAYTLISTGDLIEVANNEELESIEESLKTPYENVKAHIKASIKLFKEEPKDYRNSIKESISAVEAMCCELIWKPKATLWDALKKLKTLWIKIHPALESWFSSIYWYTCDESWIRHNLKIDSTEATFDDAKYMLVSCSAFVNYLIWKSQKITQGIEAEVEVTTNLE